MKAAAALLCLAVCLASSAKTVHAPLPPALLEAKSVYIQNDAGSADFADKCYSELSAWGRFTVVTDPKKADLIFRISSSTRTTGYHGDTSADTYGGGSSTDIHAVQSSRTQIDVIERSSGNVLWSESKAWGGLYTGFRSATKSIIKELRKRMEEQNKK